MNNIIALVGNPNAGKSTFFNSVAKAEEHVGNWHGVTTEYKEKKIIAFEKEVIITDLPGTYSLSPFSYEEAVTRDYLLNHKKCQVINIIDGNNLERNLLLTLQLIELGFSPIVCINMANEFKRNGTIVNIKKLETLLGIKCFLIDAQNKHQSKQVLNYCINKTNFGYKKQHINNTVNKTQTILKNTGYKNNTNSHLYTFPYYNQIDILFSKFRHSIKCDNISFFEKVKVLEQDESILNNLIKDKQDIDILNNELEQNKTLESVMNLRYNLIKKIITGCVILDKKKVYGYSKVDKYVLNKWLSFPIFFVIIALIFYLTFGNIGSFLSNQLSLFVEKIFLSPLISFVNNSVSNQFVSDFVSYAFCGSIVSIVSFLPQVVLMFLGLYVLEDSGYMSRIAFTFEDFLKKVGLSGKSIFALLMSFGCSTTATLSSRNLENKNSKIKTAMLTPYISCTAKLPLYSIICAAFFPKFKFLIVLCLYLLGVIVALTVSYFLNKTLLKSDSTTFVMEMPKYRIPSIKKLSKNIFVNTKQFLLRAGSVLLGFSCIIWIIQNCNFSFQYQVGESMLETISNFISPIFIPLGFGTAGAVSTILCGFVAKEIIVSSISIINGLGGTSNLSDISNSLLLSTSAFFLTQSSSLSFLVFALLYLPCISTVSVMIKEIGRKWTLFACLMQFAISYCLSFATYKISNYFLLNGFLSGFIALVTFVLICIFIIVSFNLLKNKKTCKYCPAKKYCNKKS